MQITVDPDRCVGSGQCVLAAETVFDQSEDSGEVLLLRSSVPADEEEAVLDAISNCPAGALAWARE
ncbi:ferredoxin [Streptomyces canus]|uniref:ferredoxin n=1 Tax=Streptomyces canus TaxID=58343 RepID=UPI002E25E9CA